MNKKKDIKKCKVNISMICKKKNLGYNKNKRSVSRGEWNFLSK